MCVFVKGGRPLFRERNAGQRLLQRYHWLALEGRHFSGNERVSKKKRVGKKREVREERHEEIRESE